MSETIFRTVNGKYSLTEYSAGRGKGVCLQITDTSSTSYNADAFINGITKKDAKEIGEALIKWAGGKDV